MKNTITDVIRFIFEVDPTYGAISNNSLLTQFGLTTEVAMSSFYIGNQSINKITLDYHEETTSAPVSINKSWYGYAYIFPVRQVHVWYELILERRDCIVRIAKLDPMLSTHKRFIGRAAMLARALFPYEHYMEHITDEIEYLDVSKPATVNDDIFVLKRITDYWCMLGCDRQLLEYCDENGLMEHKMIIMRRIHENVKNAEYETSEIRL